MTGTPTIAVDVVVSGRVQGVSFRAYAEAEARRLRVTGWIRNEPDGSVAGHFEGPQPDVDALVAWCHQGSPYATVRRVATSPAPVAGHARFEVRY